MNRRTLIGRGIAALVAVSGMEKLAPAAHGAEPTAAAAAAPLPLRATRPLPIHASGGLCAPVKPYYEIPLAHLERPVRDALPSFGASRDS